jgi:hypothetical protein
MSGSEMVTMPDTTAVRDRIAMARVNLAYSVEFVLRDLGDIGRAKREEIMDDITEELDEIAELAGDDDDA